MSARQLLAGIRFVVGTVVLVVAILLPVALRGKAVQPAAQPEATEQVRPDSFRALSGDGSVMARVEGLQPVSDGRPQQVFITITNSGPKSIRLATDACGLPAVLFARLQLPLAAGGSEPVSQTEFVKFILANGRIPGGFASSDPYVAQALGLDCVTLDALPTLTPGESVTREAVLRTDLVPGVPAGRQDVPVTLRVDYLPADVKDDDDPLYGHTLDLTSLTATTTIRLTAGEPAIIDREAAATLAAQNSLFGEWLVGTPEDTWVAANQFLLDARSAGIPQLADGPYWEVDLFARSGAKWRGGIVLLSAKTGEVADVRICDLDCGIERGDQP